MVEPRACPDCLRRARLLALLGPYIEKIATGTPGSRSPELLRLSNEDLVAVAAPSAAEQMLASIAAIPEADLRSGAGRCRLLGRLSPRRPLPGLAARRGRRALGAGRPRRPGAAPGPRAVRHGDDRRRPPRDLLRPRDRTGAGAGAGERGDGRRQRPRLRGRRRAPTAVPSTPGRTIAVLGCGPDVAYPASHRSLWRRIAERGLVLSELPPGATPWRWTFPARNRIMAALAGMTVVVEAAARSGSLITADLAADLGREIGAVPGPVTSRASAGPNNLLAGGACVIRDAQDVLDAMLGPGKRTIERSGPVLEPSPRRCPRGGRGGGVQLRRGGRGNRRLRA